MKKSTKILFTVWFSLLIVVLIPIIIRNTQTMLYFFRFSKNENTLIFTALQNLYFTFFYLSIAILLVIAIVFIWRYEITLFSKDKYEEIKQKHLQRKEDKKKAQIDKKKAQIDKLEKEINKKRGLL